MTIARTPSYSRLWSWLYMVLLAVIPYVRLKPVGTLWMSLWTRTSRMRRGTIKAEIHGESVLLNYENSYPINCPPGGRTSTATPSWAFKRCAPRVSWRARWPS